jgi:hypothetical protein
MELRRMAKGGVLRPTNALIAVINSRIKEE